MMIKKSKRLFCLLLIFTVLISVIPSYAGDDTSGESIQSTSVSASEESGSGTEEESATQETSSDNTQENTQIEETIATSTSEGGSESLPQESLTENIPSESLSETQGDASISEGTTEENTTYTNSISGMLWYDKNSDGTREEGEEGIASYPVYLYEADDTDNAVQTVTTDEDGEYTFTDIDPGDYLVGVKSNELGTDYYLLPIKAVTGDNKLGTWSDEWDEKYSDTITIDANSTITDMDAGLRTPPGIQPMAAYTINMSSPAATTGVTYASNVLTFTTAANGNTYTISGTAIDTATIVIPAGVTANITLNACTIENAKTSPIVILGTANITLVGTSTMTMDSVFAVASDIQYNAGIYVGSSATLNITATNSSGKLLAYGGTVYNRITSTGGGSSTYGNGGAGIGGSGPSLSYGGYGTCGTIDIAGYADVTAVGGGTTTGSNTYGGAGIGGGGYVGVGGTVTIRGSAKVTAQGGGTTTAGTLSPEGGAGIGGGARSAGGTTKITGGTVTATGGGTGTTTAGNGGAGIGGGSAGAGGTIEITGGTVIATAGGTGTSGSGGAGIGGGSGRAGGDITISGSSTKVTATGKGTSYGGAGIGGGGRGDGGTIKISGSTVDAIGGGNDGTGYSGAGIGGGGYGGNGGDITISGSTVEATGGGNSTSTSGSGGAGIGGGSGGSGGTGGDIMISNSFVEATGGNCGTSGYGGAGIGGGGSHAGGNITISDSTVEAIGGGNSTSGYGGAGIGGGGVGTGGDITINSSIVEATGGGSYGGAGIGGGYSGDGGDITINSGTVEATGGGTSRAGAGIGGGGYTGACGSIYLKAGTVTAIGGTSSSTSYAPYAIGGGRISSYLATEVEISPSVTLTAYSQSSSYPAIGASSITGDGYVVNGYITNRTTDTSISSLEITLDTTPSGKSITVPVGYSGLAYSTGTSSTTDNIFVYTSASTTVIGAIVYNSNGSADIQPTKQIATGQALKFVQTPITGALTAENVTLHEADITSTNFNLIFSAGTETGKYELATSTSFSANYSYHDWTSVSTDPYIWNLINLPSNTQYYFRSTLTNQIGATTSAIKSFITKPDVTSSSVSITSGTTAALSCSVADEGVNTANISSIKIYISTTSSQPATSYVTLTSGYTTTGFSNYDISGYGLTAGATYYYWIEVSNEITYNGETIGGSTTESGTFTMAYTVTENYVNESGSQIQLPTTETVPITSGTEYYQYNKSGYENIMTTSNYYVYQGYTVGTYNPTTSTLLSGLPEITALTGNATVYLVYKEYSTTIDVTFPTMDFYVKSSTSGVVNNGDGGGSSPDYYEIENKSELPVKVELTEVKTGTNGLDGITFVDSLTTPAADEVQLNLEIYSGITPNGFTTGVSGLIPGTIYATPVELGTLDGVKMQQTWVSNPTSRFGYVYLSGYYGGSSGLKSSNSPQITLTFNYEIVTN